jgi:two-component system cell cycle sensor histidine kinase/response regulator CckA
LKRYTRAGFRSIVAENGAAGLEAFLVEPNTIDLVLADVVMPVMDGITMIREIRKVQPNIPVLFMSAYSHKVVTVNETKFPLINKPFIADDLIRTVTKTLDSLTKERRAAPIGGKGSNSWLRRIGRG